ncbi:hypothetical protein [Leeia aquatica]|uniref:Uncharacterized protein n=1 Tax=Leeia aquatica TaxID=2725557 RepID=A0A847SC87_9NEIS|nr:hypothetical protein [Leeia aquatica]NLR73562.1 hypothetical protein [Leeia aquatica]
MATNQKEKGDGHGLLEILKLYWAAYGGWRALWRSPYLWLSFCLLLLTTHYWLTEAWWEQVFSVMPSMLGFTLGGFAVFLGFGDEKFKSIISGQMPEDGGRPSPYLEVSATFLHFVLVQMIALISAVIARATNFALPVEFSCLTKMLGIIRVLGDMVGYWLYLYGLCITAAAALAIFRTAHWYDTHQTNNRENQ